MKITSADVYTLINHLKKCPIEFLQPSILIAPGSLHTDALVFDVLRKIAGNSLVPATGLPTLSELKSFNQNQLISIHMGCWFFWQDLFLLDPLYVAHVNSFLMKELPALSRHVSYQKYIDDDERTEEFVRLALRSCSILPSGETQQEAEDKLDALNTIKRLVILKETNDKLQRMKAIKKKMEEDKAREAATVYSRE